jgi:hypothetical protein
VARTRETTLRRLALGLLYLASLVAVTLWLWRGWSYYRLDETARPLHRDYARLTSGGELGHFFGLAGSALILLLLLYVVRKRWKALERAGSLRTWLDVHIWMGITGPLLILLHSAFKVGGLVAFSFWSMTAVAFSGVLGRYLYLQIPRDESGEELDSQGIQSRQESLLRESGLAWESLPESIRREMGAAGSGLLAWLRDDLAWLARRGRWRTAQRGAGVADPAPALGALRRLEVLQRRRGTLELARRLLHHWHVFHRPFAYIMILFMIVHVIVVQLFQGSYGVAP